MISTVIYCRSTAPTAREIAREISERQGYPCNIGSPASEGKAVRWGNSSFGDINCLNKSQPVALAANKLAAIRAMAAAGVRVPGEYPLDFTPPTGKLRIFRKNNRHSGNDYPIITDGVAPEGYDYSIEYLQSDLEYRVHVFLGRHLRTQEKRKKYYNADPYVRSCDRGWCLRKTEPIPQLTEIAVKAVMALGLDFGAADIIHGVDGSYYVLEVNTAPGLAPQMVKLYAKRIIEWGERQ